ncbi:hypothetical protein ACFPOE_01410 [Caenimonas terrae]|uniref:Uncharacterized protein n=1 Tax=Caenimonas terrae TaxID=696074 RepID=A0ABW0NAH0_9BURK
MSATVLKRATLTVLKQPASILVTEADVARGYLAVPSAVQVAVQTNSPAGYVLLVAAQDDFVREIVMSGLDSDIQLGAAGGLVFQRGGVRGVTRKNLDLRFRLVLAKGAQRGEHPWPVQLSVTPL